MLLRLANEEMVSKLRQLRELEERSGGRELRNYGSGPPDVREMRAVLDAHGGKLVPSETLPLSAVADTGE